MIWKSVKIENFKGCRSLTVDFTDKTLICGQNASGKTTVDDAVTWLLFGKDSQDREKFEIRPLDSDGNKIHNIEISVVGVCEVDGKEYTFSRKQKENWVKKRGSENPVLQGNTNEMEINGFPKSDKEYKDEISNIVDEGLFKALSNPMYFPSLPWKDQRQMLMGFVSDISDVDLAKEIGGFDDILSDLEYANNTDDIAKKYAKAKKELSEKAKEIPVRIDEIEKSRVYIDKDALENKKKGIENQIDSLDKQIAKGKVDISDLETELNKVNLDISRCTATADEALREKRSSLKDSLSDAERELKNKKFEKSTYTDRIVNAKNDIRNREEKLERMKADYLEVKSHKMSANATKCPACGREFDKDRIDEITKHFTEERTNKLIQIDKIASETAESIDNLNKDIDAWNEKISIIEKEIDTIEQLVEGIKREIDNIPDTPDYEDSDKYKELITRKDKIEVEMAERLANTDDISELEIKRKELKDQLSNIDEELAKESMNQDIDNRVENLESEMRTVQQKIADAERMEYQLNKFIKAKMESVSKTINDQFEICDFKLFETQINGGIKECCEMTVNGVPYSSLNSGHKIIGGVDIVKSLQRLLGAKLPIWIDNAETVNEYNMPDIDCQMVLLKVTDDKELSIR